MTTTKGKNLKGASSTNVSPEEIIDRNVLDGFDLETKLRKTIYDLLQPIGTKQSEVERRVIQMQT
jgi:hypothetical protein